MTEEKPLVAYLIPKVDTDDLRDFKSGIADAFNQAMDDDQVASSLSLDVKLSQDAVNSLLSDIEETFQKALKPINEALAPIGDAQRLISAFQGLTPTDLTQTNTAINSVGESLKTQAQNVDTIKNNVSTLSFMGEALSNIQNGLAGISNTFLDNQFKSLETTIKSLRPTENTIDSEDITRELTPIRESLDTTSSDISDRVDAVTTNLTQLVQTSDSISDTFTIIPDGIADLNTVLSDIYDYMGMSDEDTVNLLEYIDSMHTLMDDTSKVIADSFRGLLDASVLIQRDVTETIPRMLESANSSLSDMASRPEARVGQDYTSSLNDLTAYVSTIDDTIDTASNKMQAQLSDISGYSRTDLREMMDLTKVSNTNLPVLATILSTIQSGFGTYIEEVEINGRNATEARVEYLDANEKSQGLLSNLGDIMNGLGNGALTALTAVGSLLGGIYHNTAERLKSAFTHQDGDKAIQEIGKQTDTYIEMVRESLENPEDPNNTAVYDELIAQLLAIQGQIEEYEKLESRRSGEFLDKLGDKMDSIPMFGSTMSKALEGVNGALMSIKDAKVFAEEGNPIMASQAKLDSIRKLGDAGFGGLMNLGKTFMEMFEKLWTMIVSASPMLGNILSLFDTAIQLILMPIGNKIAEIMIPDIIDIMDRIGDIWETMDGMDLGEMIEFGVTTALGIFFAKMESLINVLLHSNSAWLSNIGKILVVVEGILKSSVMVTLGILLDTTVFIFEHLKEFASLMVGLFAGFKTYVGVRQMQINASVKAFQASVARGLEDIRAILSSKLTKLSAEQKANVTRILAQMRIGNLSHATAISTQTAQQGIIASLSGNPLTAIGAAAAGAIASSLIMNAVMGVAGLATGGKVPATEGGQLFVLGEGGEAEYVVPESKAERFANDYITNHTDNSSRNVYNIYINGYTDSQLKQYISDVVDEKNSLARIRAGF